MPVFEDDCYSDLIWDGKRPPALYAMSKARNVIHIGSFSKSIAPALRVGFLVAPWAIMSRMLPLKTDAGSGALEQMVLAEYCAPHFAAHVPALRKALRAKVETLMETLNEQFGTAAEFDDPKGGIFLWVKLPDNVDTMKLYQAALKEGVAINPGAGVVDRQGAQRRRACASVSRARRTQQIREGIAILAEVCRKRVRRAGAQRECGAARGPELLRRGLRRPVAELGENLLIVLAERGRRRLDARAAMREHERRERHAEAAVDTGRAGVAMQDAAASRSADRPPPRPWCARGRPAHGAPAGIPPIRPRCASA